MADPRPRLRNKSLNERSMKIEAKTRPAWVIECPSCRKPVDFQKDDYVLFPTKESAEEFAEVWMITDPRTLSEICGCTG